MSRQMCKLTPVRQNGGFSFLQALTASTSFCLRSSGKGIAERLAKKASGRTVFGAKSAPYEKRNASLPSRLRL